MVDGFGGYYLNGVFFSFLLVKEEVRGKNKKSGKIIYFKDLF